MIQFMLSSVWQHRTNEVLLWDRPDLCLLNVLSGHQGNTDRCLGWLGVNLCSVFVGPVSEVGKGQIQYSYLCMCSLRVGLRVGCAYAWAAIRSQPATLPTFRQAAVGVIGQHATHRCPKLKNCICAIAQIHACHCVFFYGTARMHVRYHDSHALWPHQSNELLLRDLANSWFLLAFTRVLAIAG